MFVASQSSCFFLCSREQIRLVENRLKQAADDDDDDKLYLTTLTLSAEAGFHNGRVKKR